ncbi:DUF6510 family protein [Microbacterium binotii]|uniref:DUF6510 family protein n=1 Tax=Microbacterium binotii TaxID=462710 RepID=UPI001F2A4EE3|nr:DUF6510 family protein [Microbacterium binotii]UIN31794.1 DUF6510 family protein [Microbacterium binotii]
MDSTPHVRPDPRRVAQRVDGNALAGMLDAFAGLDPALLVLTCGHCGRSAALAEWSVEMDAAAAIVRCRGCTRTFATIFRRDGGIEVRAAGGSISTTSAV